MSSYFHEVPKDLYIYYLNGRIDAQGLKSLSNFLGLWEESDGLSFLFFSSPSLSSVQNLLKKEANATIIDVYQMSYAEWHGGQICSFSIGDIVFRPIWESPCSGVIQDREIVFDPGVVFGSGGHVTTRSCLQALDCIFQQEDLSTALDLGTGSGILALAAAKYGCQKVVAVDLNPLAVSTTQFNILKNGLEGTILPCQARAEELLGLPAELLIANIHYEVLQKLVLSTDFYLYKWVILSGILRSQYYDLLQLLKQRPVDITKVWPEGQVWYTILGRVLS